MSYWYDQMARMKSNGNTIRERNIDKTKRSIINSFFDSPSYYKVNVYPSSTPMVSTPLDCWITDDSKIKDQKRITAYVDQNLDKGYLVDWKNDYWLTTQSDEDFGDIYSRGTLLRCVGSLKWLDDGQKFETPFCFRIDTPSNFGVDDSKKVLVMPDERRHITIQANKHTMKFRKDQRFIVDNRAWKTITIDSLIRGVINLVLVEDEINSSIDNMELEIANYYDSLNDYRIEILNPIEKLESDFTYQILSNIYNNDILIDATPTYKSTDTNIAFVDNTGLVFGINNGNVDIIISYIDTSETISLQILDTSVTNDYVVFDTPLYINTLQTKTFNVHYENNGLVVSDSSIFSLSNLDGSNTNLVEILSQSGNSCRIKANNKLGSFKLKVTNVDETVNDEKVIEIRSIL